MNHSADTGHEDLLDVFRAAALSVTKLYKTSASAQAKARIDGYQDCLEDLLAVIDKGDVDLRTVRWWITERLEGREPILPTIESEDEVEKTDVASASAPESRAASAVAVAATLGGRSAKTDQRQSADVAMQTDHDTPPPAAARQTGSGTPLAMPSAAARTGTPAEMPTTTIGKLRTGGSGNVKGVAMTGATTADATAATAPATSEAAAAATAPHSSEPDAVAVETTEATVPMQDVFTFRSAMPYPPSESYLELANLDLSDRRSSGSATSDAASSGLGSPPTSHSIPPASTTSPSSTRPFRVRHSAARSGLRSTALPRHGRNTAGQKRKLNFDEIFDLASIGYGKDVFGRGGGKRSRQT